MGEQQRVAKSKKGRYAAGRPKTEIVRKIWNYIYDELKNSRENNKISKFNEKLFSCAYFNKILHIVFFHKHCELMKSFAVSEAEYEELKEFITKASTKFDFVIEDATEKWKFKNSSERKFVVKKKKATVCDSEEKV